MTTGRRRRATAEAAAARTKKSARVLLGKRLDADQPCAGAAEEIGRLTHVAAAGKSATAAGCRAAARVLRIRARHAPAGPSVSSASWCWLAARHLQVDDHPQQVLRLCFGCLNALDSVADYVERGSQIGRGLVFLQGQRPLRLQGLQLLHRRLRGIGPVQQLPPRGGAFGWRVAPVSLLFPHLQGAGRSRPATRQLPSAWPASAASRSASVAFTASSLLARGQLAVDVAQQAHQFLGARRHIGQRNGGRRFLFCGVTRSGRRSALARLRLTLAQQRPERIALWAIDNGLTASARSRNSSPGVVTCAVRRTANRIRLHKWRLPEHAAAIIAYRHGSQHFAWIAADKPC